MNSNTVGAGVGSQREAAGWLDFYALLGVSAQAESGDVRRRIGEAYAEATANVDHRDLSRRHYFQTMVEQVLPQCRRVLLDPALRVRYDEENARHARGEADALDYVSFMASLQGASADSARRGQARPSEFDLLPERVREEINLARAVIEAVQTGSEFDLLPARTLTPAPQSPSASAVPFSHDADAIAATPNVQVLSPQPPSAQEPDSSASPPDATAAQARASQVRARAASRPRPQATPDEYLMGSSSGALSGLSETMPVDRAASTSGGSASPVASPSSSSNTRWVDEGVDSDRIVAERMAQLREEGRERRRPEPIAPEINEAGPGVSTREDRQPVTQVPNSTEPQIRAKVIDLEAQGKSIAQLREEAQARAVSGDLSVAGSRREPEKKPYRSRVVVGEEPAPTKAGGAGRERALLSPIATHLAAGAISAALLGIILSLRATPDAGAAAAPRVPLSVVYSSELAPILKTVEAGFRGSAEGKQTDLVLAPMDSRSAMNSVLSPPRSGGGPDVWIPSEAVWSNRFNEVAPRYKRRAMRAGAGLALSPLVLVARSDRAAGLRAKFPNRLLPSWSVLREMVARDCANHFGMTNPERSGGGALVRTAMAREWCAVNRVPFSPAAMSDKKLWSWMNGFESNVPQYKMAGEMVQDLALSTSAQYWWALAYESDAIYWIGQGKPLEVFYLPTTFYADHPFCRIDRDGASATTSAASARLEKFLRSPRVQQAFLRSGFRAPELDLNTKLAGNPFHLKQYMSRGVRASGFPVGGRLDYRSVNALIAAWQSRVVS